MRAVRNFRAPQRRLFSAGSEAFTWDSSLHWKDPLRFEDQLSEDERMLRMRRGVFVSNDKVTRRRNCVAPSFNFSVGFGMADCFYGEWMDVEAMEALSVIRPPSFCKTENSAKTTC